jgi:DNA (cytosine-5)-methyltransferase 1
MKADWLAEIEPFPSAVLAHHYPDTPNHGDMTKLAALVLARKIKAPDVLVGGTPCQAFSVAGMREGLSDPRGALTIKYVELADAIDYVRALDRKPPAVTIWENVPGVLSDKGNAFGCFLGALAGEDSELHPSGKRWTDAGCVYGPKRTIAWRILDAQYFGLAQRRRRVFVVSSARAGFDPSTILFERESVRRDSPPVRGQGEKAAGTLDARTNGGGFPGTDGACDGHVIATSTGDISHCLNAGGMGRIDYESETMVVHGTQDPITAPALRAQAQSSHRADSEAFIAVCVTGEITHTLKADGFDGSEDGTGRGQPITQVGSSVRRLTPVECERLQGFPDGYTLIPWRNKDKADCPDGPRYKALGNSKAVPVVRWIGKRLLAALQMEH